MLGGNFIKLSLDSEEIEGRHPYERSINLPVIKTHVKVKVTRLKPYSSPSKRQSPCPTYQGSPRFTPGDTQYGLIQDPESSSQTEVQAYLVLGQFL